MTSAKFMPAAVTTEPATPSMILGRVHYNLTEINPHSRAFMSTTHSSRHVLDNCVIPDLSTLGIPLPTFATIYDRKKGEVLCHWEVNTEGNVSLLSLPFLP